MSREFDETAFEAKFVKLRNHVDGIRGGNPDLTREQRIELEWTALASIYAIVSIAHRGSYVGVILPYARKHNLEINQDPGKWDKESLLSVMKHVVQSDVAQPYPELPEHFRLAMVPPDSMCTILGPEFRWRPYVEQLTAHFAL